MKTNQWWIWRKKYVVAPIFLLVLLLAIAACGTSATEVPTATNVVPATTQAEDAMPSDDEKMADDAMAGDDEKMADDAMDSDEEKLADDAVAKDDDKMAEDAMMESGASLKLDFPGVQPLANGYHFEGWAIIDGNPVSTGKFNIGPNGELLDLEGIAKTGGIFDWQEGLDMASSVVITIEPAGDIDDIPTATHYLAGSVLNGMADLSVGHAAALGDDFSSAAGAYILATPTDGADTNENSGLWFLDLSSGSPDVGLELPVLPEGWVYEGWAVIDGMPVSSGQFTAVEGMDFSAPHSGPEPGPPFPGEDYLNNAPASLTFPTDLSGGTAVISVEPSPDDSSAPFTLKPLFGAIPEDAVDRQTYQLESGVNNFPTGTAVIGDF